MARTRPDHAAEALLSKGRALFSLAIIGLGIETLVCSTLYRSLRRTLVPSHLCASQIPRPKPSRQRLLLAARVHVVAGGFARQELVGLT